MLRTTNCVSQHRHDFTHFPRAGSGSGTTGRDELRRLDEQRVTDVLFKCRSSRSSSIDRPTTDCAMETVFEFLIIFRMSHAEKPVGPPVTGLFATQSGPSSRNSINSSKKNTHYIFVFGLLSLTVLTSFRLWISRILQRGSQRFGHASHSTWIECWRKKVYANKEWKLGAW